MIQGFDANNLENGGVTQADGKEGGPQARKGQTEASTPTCLATLAASCCTRLCKRLGPPGQDMTQHQTSYIHVRPYS